MENVILLLTGTVTPKNMVFTKLLDPEVRKRQYLESLTYWLKATNLKIIFVENSGTDLSTDLEVDHQGRIEFITFNGNDHPKEKGKGYGELKCLEYASLNSVLYQQAKFIFKVTGRIQIHNLEKFVHYYENHSDIDLFIDVARYFTYVDSRLFGFRPEFLAKYFIGRIEEVNDSNGVYFEDVLARAVLQAVLDGKKFHQFPFYPAIYGVSGTDNRNYRSDFFYLKAKQVEYRLKSWFINN